MNNNLKPITTLPPFKRLCMSIGELPTSYLETMTYYEMLVWFTEYMKNTVIPTINNNGEAVSELQSLYIQLHDYVENYFDNLDVQEEINNKLDEMVEEGTLQEIITDYLNTKAIFCYDNVAEMTAATNLIDGSYAKTLGYYAKNDGGIGLYKISETYSSNDKYETLTNGLYAILITSLVNPMNFGAYGDGTHNDTTSLQAASNYAQTNGLNLYIPNKTFLTDTITIENINHVRIDGEIKLSANTQTLNVYENVNTNTPDIFIEKVTVGDIVMKGLNSGNITILNGNKLILLADNTTGHNFIGYNTFNLGYIRYLELKDDGSGTKWINENHFIGGRFLGLTIGGNQSSYSHQNNLFSKPKCENTVINIVKGAGNRILDARLEGTSSITFGETAVANVITSDFAQTDYTYFIPKYYSRFDTTNVIDNSGGKNMVICNENLTENLVLSLNKFNNPKNLTVSGDNITASSGNLMFESDFVSLPTVDSLLFFNSSNKMIAWRIECYDETFTKLSSNPNLFISPTVIAYTSAGTYGNASFNRNTYWGLLDSKNELVKYIKIKVFCPSGQGLSNEPYKNIDMYLTHYGKLDNEGYYIKGLGTQTTAV